MKYVLLKNEIIIYFLTVLLFLLLVPYFLWHAPLIRHIVEVLFVVGCIPFFDIKIARNRMILSLILLFLIVYLISDISLTGMISNLFLLVIFNLKDEFKVRIFNALVDVFAIVVGISLIMYLLVCWFSVPIPYNIIDPLNPLKETNYLQYPFLVVYDSVYNFANMRFYSVFDEPGVVGTVAVILLYGNEYKLNSWQYIIIFIAGLFSFSFFFIVMSILCLFRKKYFKYIIFVILVSVLVFFIFHNFFIQYNDLFEKLIFSRFTAEGNYGGNRVDGLFNQEYNKYLLSNDVFWGRGSEELSKILSGGSSYKSLIYSNGIIWFCTLCIFFVLNIFIISKNKRNIIYSILVFFSVLYQRPNAFDLPYFFMFITLPLVLKNKNEYRFSISHTC